MSEDVIAAALWYVFVQLFVFYGLCKNLKVQSNPDITWQS